MNFFDRLRFIVLMSALMFLRLETVNGLSGSRLCADKSCQEVISDASGKIDYPAGKKGMISFKKAGYIKVLWKGHGSNSMFWGIDVNGDQGYAPKEYIQENKVRVKRNSLIEVEMPLAAVIAQGIDNKKESESKSLADDGAIGSSPATLNENISISLSEAEQQSEESTQKLSPNKPEEALLDVDNSNANISESSEQVEHENVKTKPLNATENDDNVKTIPLVNPKSEIMQELLASPAVTETNDQNKTTEREVALPIHQLGTSTVTEEFAPSAKSNEEQYTQIGELRADQNIETTNENTLDMPLHGNQNIPMDKTKITSTMRQSIKHTKKSLPAVNDFQQDISIRNETVEAENVTAKTITSTKAEIKQDLLPSPVIAEARNPNETTEPIKESLNSDQLKHRTLTNEIATSAKNNEVQNTHFGEFSANQTTEEPNQNSLPSSHKSYVNSNTESPMPLHEDQNIPVDKTKITSTMPQSIENARDAIPSVNDFHQDISIKNETVEGENVTAKIITSTKDEIKQDQLPSPVIADANNLNEKRTTKESFDSNQLKHRNATNEFVKSNEDQNIQFGDLGDKGTLEKVNHNVQNSLPPHRKSTSSSSMESLLAPEILQSNSSQQEPLYSSSEESSNSPDLDNVPKTILTSKEMGLPTAENKIIPPLNAKEPPELINDTSDVNKQSDQTKVTSKSFNKLKETVIDNKNLVENVLQVHENGQIINGNSSSIILDASGVTESENVNKYVIDMKTDNTFTKMTLNPTSSQSQKIKGDAIEVQSSEYTKVHESFEQRPYVNRTDLEIGLVDNSSVYNKYEDPTENLVLNKRENHENAVAETMEQSLKLDQVAEISNASVTKQDQYMTQITNQMTTTELNGAEEQTTDAYMKTQVDERDELTTTPPSVLPDIPQIERGRNMVEDQPSNSSGEGKTAVNSEADSQRINSDTAPSIWPREIEEVKQQRGLFATILETVNSFISNDKREPAHVEEAELDRILYPEKHNDDEYCEKFPFKASSSKDDSCHCDVVKVTMNNFTENLAARILNISDILACLAVTAASALVFLFGYYCFCNSSREAVLLSKLNLLERSLLASNKENIIIKHELRDTSDKLSSIEDSSFGANEMVVGLKKDLDAALLEKKKAQDQIGNLEKELENATEAGFELNKIVSELLNNKTGEELIINSVEQLQKQLNEQQNTILEINTNLAEKSRENSELHLMIAEQSVRLNGEIASLQQDNDELETEKSNLQTRLEEVKDEFQKEIAKALEMKNMEIKRLQAELTDFATKCEDQYTKWQTSLAKIEALEDCLKSLKKDPKVNIKEVFDAANVRAEILDIQKQRAALKERLEAEKDTNNMLEDQVKTDRAEIERLKRDFNQSEKDKLEAQTRLEVLSNYFKEKETQLQKELSLKEAMWLKQQGEKTSTVDRLTSMQAEIQSLKSQNDSLRAEIDAQIAAHKAQIGTLENRAHETWLAARQSERRCEEARAESAVLRRKLTALAGGNTNEVNLDGKLSTDLNNASSPIQLDTSESSLLGRMPPPPFMPHPFIGPMPPFMGIPPPFLPPGQIRPPPLGRLRSPPPQPGCVSSHSNHMRSRRYTPPDINESDNYDDDDEDADEAPHRGSRWYSSPSQSYRSHSPDSRYTRDIMSTYETDFSPPPSSRDRRSRGSRAGSFTRSYSPQPLASSPIVNNGRKGKKSVNAGSPSSQKHTFQGHNTSSDSGSASGISDAEHLSREIIW